MRCFIIFKIKVCPPPPTPHPNPANPLYCRRVLSIYTICVSGKLVQGVGGRGTIFSKPKKMSGQTPEWKKYIQMTFKMGSRSPNHSQIFASCHLCKLVQDYYNIEIVLILLGVKTIATNANRNVDVKVYFT